MKPVIHDRAGQYRLRRQVGMTHATKGDAPCAQFGIYFFAPLAGMTEFQYVVKSRVQLIQHPGRPLWFVAETRREVEEDRSELIRQSFANRPVKVREHIDRTV